MFKFAINNLKTKKVKFILTTLTMFICILISIFFYNVACQTEEGVINSSSTYDTIIGSNSSPLELTLSTLFYMDYPLETIDYNYYEKYSNDPDVSYIFPFASGDTYKDVKIIGTLCGYLNDMKMKQGRNLNNGNVYEAVLGYNVAKDTGLKIGDTFISTHGSLNDGHEHEDTPYTVVGILDKSNTSSDTVIFTEITSIWSAHNHEDDEEMEEEEHIHNEIIDKGELTSIILKTKNLSVHNKIVNELKNTPNVQAVNPATELRKLLSNIGMVKNIIYIMVIFILVLSIMMIYITTTSSVNDSKEDIAIMRLIGIKRKNIHLMLFIQTLFSFFISVIFAFLFKFILLYITNLFTSGNFGIMMSSFKFYLGEIYIVLFIFILIIISMLLSMISMFRKDPLDI